MANKKLYDFVQFQAILQLIKKYKFHESIHRLQEYLSDYPMDYKGYACYIDCFLKMGNFEQAESILEITDAATKMNDEAKEALYLIKLKLLCCTKRYEEALDLLRNGNDFIDINSSLYNDISFFLKQKLGRLIPNVDYHSTVYMINQMYDYDEKKTISHLQSAAVQQIIKEKKPNGYGKFNDDFPCQQVIEKARLLLPQTDRLYDSSIVDAYFCEFPNCGIINSKSVDYIKFTAIRDTNHII